jgi:hypothetical protein
MIEWEIHPAPAADCTYWPALAGGQWYAPVYPRKRRKLKGWQK